MQPTTGLTELFPPTTPDRQASSPSELGQEDFLELMVAQLENQDPTKPMDNFEFLSQIAQFGTVDGIQGLQDGFSDMAGILYANQTLQAAALVGSKVMTESNVGTLAEGESLAATIEVPANNTGAALYIQDASGRLVHTRDLGVLQPGEVKVQWDGLDDAGNPVQPGQYRVSAEVAVGGAVQAAPVYTHSLVESVTVDRADGGVTLNLAGGDQVRLGQVKSFL